jgi:protein TonB
MSSALLHLALLLFAAALLPPVFRRWTAPPDGIVVHAVHARTPTEAHPLPRLQWTNLTPNPYTAVVFEDIQVSDVFFDAEEPTESEDWRREGDVTEVFAAASVEAAPLGERTVVARHPPNPASGPPTTVVRRSSPQVHPPPAPPERARAHVRRGFSRPAKLKSKLRPAYPENMRLAGSTATVVLEVSVGADGRASAVRVLSGDTPRDFARSAIAAAKGARYRPALRDGRRVPGVVRMRIRYRLQ